MPCEVNFFSFCSLPTAQSAQRSCLSGYEYWAVKGPKHCCRPCVGIADRAPLNLSPAVCPPGEGHLYALLLIHELLRRHVVFNPSTQLNSYTLGMVPGYYCGSASPRCHFCRHHTTVLYCTALFDTAIPHVYRVSTARCWLTTSKLEDSAHHLKDCIYN